MPWAALDDQFHANPKVVAAGLDGAGLYARSISYSANYLTDGFVPEGWARETAPKRLHSRLVSVGLWDRDDDLGGYWIHDYLRFNPTRVDIEKKRLEAAERKRKSRERHDGVTPSVTRDNPRDSHESHSEARAQSRPGARPTPLTPEEPKDFEDEELLESGVHEISRLAQDIGRKL
jgi:hypothetical protein